MSKDKIVTITITHNIKTGETEVFSDKNEKSNKKEIEIKNLLVMAVATGLEAILGESTNKGANK